MQQSRLDRFFMITTNKRLSTTENDYDDNNNNKKFKRTDSSSQNNDNLENNFSLNEFYLEKFLLILSSLLKYYKDLFDENELILFENFQKLSG
jgi:hypothetical protein